MSRYHVFDGIPCAKQLLASQNVSYSWHKVASSSHQPQSTPFPLTLPPSTLAAANQRISMLYENVIFHDFNQDETDELSQYNAAPDDEELQPEGQTTVITWPATTQGDGNDRTRSVGDITFLRPSASVSRIRSQLLTQETQDTASYVYSDASSIGNFPGFHFSLHSLTSLATLTAQAHAARGRQAAKASRKVTLLVAILEMDGPDYIRIKRGPDAGKEVALVKMILGDESGGICKLSAWREVAEDWAGVNFDVPTPRTKKGDIVLLENVLITWEPEQNDNAGVVPISGSASPHLKSKLEICYRALPSVSEDARLRPDLRLGDAVVRKVASVVGWFEGVAGLS
ncbi:hypothetical protein C8Q80DRAFT_691478 [Daedaleopsis nitida]|nr:hypothetical protein C8Q80DRAFT_691478 [Daedaleopsis nitida]